MKRVIVSLLITLLIFTPAAAYAASPVSFRTSGCEIAGNRLFTVEVCATSDAPLCAALFEISYDTSAFEYRSSSAVKPALVEENDENGVLRLSYLNSDGAECSGEAVLFTLTFKSKQSGSYTFGCTVSQCVDSDASFLPVGEVRTDVITVTGSSSGSSASKSGGAASSKSGKASSSAEKKSSSSAASVTEDETEQPMEDYGVRDNDRSAGNSGVDAAAVVILCLSCAAATAGAVIAFFKLRSVIKSRKSGEKSGNSG